tara:strand:- start:6256 stop:7074 length:819 start_codon:yes stop_codon:yes gene_type:complete
MKKFSKPFFSIITPILYGERYIDNFISCLISQEFQNWECILINDGSKDKSFPLLKSKIRNETRFKITKTNPAKKKIKSPYLARNKGLEIAKGKYVCFLDIDDYWLPKKLINEFKIVLENDKPEIIIGSYIKANKNLSRGYPKPRFDLLPIKTQIKIWNACPLLSTTILRKKINNINFNPVYHEDYNFWFFILKEINSQKIFMNYKFNCIYRTSPKSQSSNKIKAANWIYKCYRSFNYPILISLLLLIIKIISEIIEKFLVLIGLIKKMRISL